MKINRLVIIGSNGVIGKKILETAVNKKISCLGLGRNDLDLLCPNALNNLLTILNEGDQIVFLAGITPDKGNNLDTLYKNVQMIQPVIIASYLKRISQIIYLSTDSMYESIEKRITEDSPILPKDCYSMMHVARECMLANSLREKLCILRCTQVFSLSDTHYSYGPSKFIQDINMEKKVYIYGSGEDLRDHIYIDDVVSAVLKIAEINLYGKFILGSGYSTSFIDIANKLIEMYNENVEIITKPRKIELKNRYFDNTLLKTTLGNWNPKNIIEVLENIKRL